MTNTGPSRVTGDVGVAPGSAITGFPPGILSGGIHANDATAIAAHAAVGTAYADAAARPVACSRLVAGNLGGQTLTPGIYKSTSTLAISSGDLTLNAEGNPNAVFIFQIADTFTTTGGRQVLLTNGAQASNIFWQVGTSATLGTTSVVHGTILANQAITMTTGASLTGRALTNIAAVTLDTNAVVNPSGTQFDYAGAYTAKLTADQSVPPTASTGGGTVAVVASNQNDGGYTVSVSGSLTGFGADTATQVHIHSSHAGRNGPILEGNLYPFTNVGAGVVTINGIQNFSQAAMQEIALGRAYVNVHTTTFGSGAVRGQILRVGDILWSAQLSGANQVPPAPLGLVGGVGFIVSPDGGVYYEGSWDSNVVATAAHIHAGAAGVSGPVVFPLNLVGTTGVKGNLSTQQADSGVEQYVNVHTTDAGNGLIRGQIVVH